MVLAPVHRVCRDERRTLRYSVALADFDAEGVKVVDKLRAERCAAADDILKSAAEGVKNVLE